jgi:hypothetical protein
VRPGDKLPSFPDAVVVADVAHGGEWRCVEIAVEYVTSKYTDADIVAKHVSFARFHNVFWFADRAQTAERVRRALDWLGEVLAHVRDFEISRDRCPADTSRPPAHGH